MRILFQREPRVIALLSETHALLLSESSRGEAVVELVENDRISGFSPLSARDVYGFLGMLSVGKHIYLAIVSGAVQDVAHPVPYESVNRIYSVEFVSLYSDEWDATAFGKSVPDDDPDVLRAVHPCHELRKLLSSGTFYYSNDFDLTSRLQDRGIEREKLESNSAAGIPLVDCHNDRDNMWNYFMMKELIKFRKNLVADDCLAMDENRFLTTVIRGFAKTVRLSSKGDTLSLVSKQSWRRAGTRFNARGIDDGGFVANFVETEFVWYSVSHHAVCAFVQVRGSVPTFWEQDANIMNPKITLTRSTQATQPMFDKHFQTLTTKYGPCHIVNLLSKTKQSEVLVSKRYRELYKNCDRPQEISFTDFDFHAETKPAYGGFAGAANILPLLRSSMEQFGWFYYDTRLNETITRQDGVFRINCLDCLDRTNLIEQVICQNVLELILENHNGRHSEEVLSLHNACWADNGDAISQIYTGTNALKSSFSRLGKMNFAGALLDVTKSVSRMYQNTFVDGKKQLTMDTLLGVDARSVPVTIYDPVNRKVQHSLRQRRLEFTKMGEARIFVGTFNVNAASPHAGVDLEAWLFPPENEGVAPPDMYAIGLQEIVELNAGSILAADGSKPAKWTEILTKQLNSRKENYVLLRTESMSSLSLHLFARHDSVAHIAHVFGSSKKTGMGGMAANKGACAVRFEYGLTSFALVSAHLAAGVAATTERFNDYCAIADGLTFPRNRVIKDHDHIIWFGDLNYRIELESAECRDLVLAGAFDDLIRHDQLTREMRHQGAFHKYREDKIVFFPTYKFDRGTSDYDTSEKQRVPSWTDRVLHLTAPDKERLQQDNYLLVMSVCISDHKPVFSTFRAPVEFVDRHKRLQLAKSLYEQYKSTTTPSSGALSLLSQEPPRPQRPDTGLVDLIGMGNPSSSVEHPQSQNTFINSAFLDIWGDSPARQTDAPLLQPQVQRSKTLSRRLPPPPPPERRNTRSAVLVPTSPMPDSANTTISAALAPLPPPRRAATTNKARLVPGTPPLLNFTSAPLVPKSSAPALPARRLPERFDGLNDKASIATSPEPENEPLRPTVPKKPASLAAAKSFKAEVPSTEAQPTEPPRSLSEWKPLVPK